MAKSSTSFGKGNRVGATSRRRDLSGSLLFSNLKDYGDEMLKVLVTHAKESEREDIRIRAADRFLCHVLLQPKEGMEESDNNEAMAQLRSQLSADEMVRLNEILKPAMQGFLNDLIAKVKEGNTNETIS